MKILAKSRNERHILNLPGNQTLCKLDGFQLVCSIFPRKENVTAYPLFADYSVDDNGEKVYKQSSPPSRPIAIDWFRPNVTEFCGGKTDAPCVNLGDELGPLLLLKLSGNNFLEKRKSMDVVVIGSVLNFLVKKHGEREKEVGSNYNITVWGAGTK